MSIEFDTNNVADACLLRDIGNLRTLLDGSPHAATVVNAALKNLGVTNPVNYGGVVDGANRTSGAAVAGVCSPQNNGVSVTAQQLPGLVPEQLKGLG